MKGEVTSGGMAASHYEAFLSLDAAVLEAVPAGVYLCSADGVIVRYNRQAATLWGQRPAIGSTEQRFSGAFRLCDLDGNDLAPDATPMEAALRTGKAQRDREVVIERPDGSRLVVLVNIEPLLSAEGRVEGAINCFQDITERKQAEAARQHLVAIVESSDDAIVSKSLNGIVATWNRGAERLFGYSADEIVGQPITLIIPEDRRHEEPAILERIRRGERVEHYETVRRRKDGSLIDISLTISPVKDRGGRIVGASKIARDISSRKQAENDLARRIEENAALYRLTDRLHRARSMEDVYDAALDAILDALGCLRASILLFDDQGVMRFVAWRGLSQDYRSKVDGHSPWTAGSVDPDPIYVDDVTTAGLSEELLAAVEAEGIGALGFIPLVGQGRLVGKFMIYYGTPHRFTENERDLAVTIARQLGFSIGRLRAEEDLRRNEERLRLATRSGRIGIWEWDVAANRISWTDSLYGMHGIDNEAFDPTVEGFTALVHPEDRERVEKAIALALDENAAYELEFRTLRPDGRIVWIFTNAIVLRNDGEPVRMLGVAFDITDRKEAEEQRGLLVAELSHRVKNTLATVLSIAQQSFSTASSAEQATRTFQARIRALGQTHGRLAEANWSGVFLVTMLADELAPYRHGANVRLSGPAVRLNARCALSLGMAIHELATNAAKYGALSSEAGAVEVGWQLDPHAGKLRIRWTESGGPPVVEPHRSGFGRLLIERALASDVQGAVELRFPPGGVTCDIAIPQDGNVAGPA